MVLAPLNAAVGTTLCRTLPDTYPTTYRHPNSSPEDRERYPPIYIAGCPQVVKYYVGYLILSAKIFLPIVAGSAEGSQGSEPRQSNDCNE
jgi:hypothetical protein